MGSSGLPQLVSELPGVAAFASLLGALAAAPSLRHGVPVSFSATGTVQASLESPRGIFVYPAILLAIVLGQRASAGGPAHALVTALHVVVAPLLLVLQGYATLVSLHGPGVAPLPQAVVPVFLLAVALVVARYSVAGLRRGAARAALQSPKSPRALIRSLSSPQDADDAADRDATTPLAKKRGPAKRGRSQSPRRSPRSAK